MVRAKCPYCGEENNVGLLEPIEPGQPTPMMNMCEHFAFFGATKYLGAEYVHQEFNIEFGKVPGSYSLEHELMRLFGDYFKFVGPVVFAPSQKSKDDGRKAVADFLRARKLLA